MPIAATPPPYVSVIVPCRQEAAWIGGCLESILEGDYPPNRIEILIVDGMSNDGSRDVVREYASKHPGVRLLDNPRCITPAALNIGVHAAVGDVIVRMDAHVVYPANYVSRLVDWLGRTGVDNVGGVIVTTPANATPRAMAIAVVLAHPFGVGNSYFRIGVRGPRLVDTVPFGCYRRSVFERIGFFDEELVRNQDDEFNMRLLRSGGRILLVPEIVCRYVSRESVAKVARMNYQYGYYKPLAVAKLGRLYSLRQLIPPAFVTTLGTLIAASIVSPLAHGPLAGLLAVYAASIGWSVLVTKGTLGVKVRLYMCLLFPSVHISYGVGYLAGLVGLLRRRWRRHRENDQAVSLSR
jgi:glycosyltransferase involved in cell wall biosynthesis